MKKFGAICLAILFVACNTDKFTGVPTSLSSFYAVRLTPESASLGVGQSQQLSVTAYDNAACPTIDSCNVLTPGNVVPVPGTATYFSLDTLVAKVSAGGVVTAVGAGTANIIATLQDIPATGSGQISVTKVDTTLFTITPAALTFGGMTLTANRATVGAGTTDTLLVTFTDGAGATISTQRAATITGTNVGRPQFYSDHPQIATIGATGIITGVEPGTAIITAVKTIGGVTKTATFAITVTDPVLATFFIRQAISSTTLGFPIIFFPSTLTVSATQGVIEGRGGAVVTWSVVSGTFDPTTTPNDTVCFNVTFADPTAAKASTTGGLTGNIGTGAAGTANGPLCSGSQSRLFTTPGTYTFTNTTNGATGTLIVK
ncbi:MAG: hypothetical protein H0W63_03100 [Gemmatimonadaceae bacterium]|nr:hypothetical protein [Gemmatimonadaceae bacterium]